ncbi:MAG: reverse transcriptase family protein [Pseudomonadota bacterium]
MRNRREKFCRQLAELYVASEWRYSVLAALSIESVTRLPADIDELINDLLARYSLRPHVEELTQYLVSSPRLKRWFVGRSPYPRVSRYVISPTANPELINGELPVLASVSDISEWLCISRGELEWLADLWRTDKEEAPHQNHYSYRTVQKSRGRIRVLEIPKTRIKAIQREINKEIVELMPVHDAAMGFRKGLSCKDHARKHVGKNFISLFDISHCFQSITWLQVKRLFARLGYPDSVAAYLAGLCSHRVRKQQIAQTEIGKALNRRLLQRHLPQGAPTSPGLANAAMFHLDKRLAGLANKFEYAYSRYADDIAFSSDNRWPREYLEPLVGAIVIDEGFELNFRKTRFKQHHQKQKIVGIVCNERINVDRKEYDNLKAILTNCVRDGITTQNRLNHPNFRAHLLGKIAYVKSLNQHKGEKLARIFEKIA